MTKSKKSNETSPQMQAYRDFYSKMKEKKPYVNMSGAERKEEINNLWKESKENPKNVANAE